MRRKKKLFFDQNLKAYMGFSRHRSYARDRAEMVKNVIFMYKEFRCRGLNQFIYRNLDPPTEGLN